MNILLNRKRLKKKETNLILNTGAAINIKYSNNNKPRKKIDILFLSSESNNIDYLDLFSFLLKNNFKFKIISFQDMLLRIKK